MRLDRVLAEDAESPGLTFVLELSVVGVSAVLINMDVGLLLGVGGILTLDFLGIRRALKRRQARHRFAALNADGPMSLVDGVDFSRDWWKDIAAAALYGLAMTLIYPTAFAYLVRGQLEYALPLLVATFVAALPPVVLAVEGISRLVQHVRHVWKLRGVGVAGLLTPEAER